jgi:hypothetical protein
MVNYAKQFFMKKVTNKVSIIQRLYCIIYYFFTVFQINKTLIWYYGPYYSETSLKRNRV